MKRILFLFLPLLPYLASAQVAKDTVTVLTYAKVMCMLDPSSGVYQWVVTNYNKY